MEAAAMVGQLLLFNVLFTMALTYLNSFGKQHSVVPLATSEGSLDLKRNNPLELSSRRKSTYEIENEDRNAVSSPRRAGSVNETRQNKRRGMALPFEPLAITFSDIHYAVDMPLEMKAEGVTENRLEILKGMSGAFRPGVLTALMGISGAGKTTLFDVLAGRKTGGYIEGQICISGYPKKQETFARVAGYCEQTDIHSPNVTVFESLMYSSWLRLPAEVDTETREMFVEEVMETPLRQTLVGLPGIYGLSTEHQKRLTVADGLYDMQLIITINNIRFCQLQVEKSARDAFARVAVYCEQTDIHSPNVTVFDEQSFGDVGDRVITTKSMLVCKAFSYVFNLPAPSGIQFGKYKAELNRHLHRGY